jgi:uncharacterized protein (TIGR00266 family)
VAICSNCGAQIQSGSKFCGSCGAPSGAGDARGNAAAMQEAGKPMKRMDEVEFLIYGDDIQFVEIMLDPGETIVSEAGAMMYMDSAIETDTIFGDGSAQSQGTGIGGKLMSAAKRAITGESLFMNTFRNTAPAKKCVAFAAPYPGKIVALDLSAYGGVLICQKSAFLCAAFGVSVGIALQKKLGVGLFGGEGFIMQKLEGDGLTFMHAGGTLIKKELAPGETLKLDTGCLVALTQSVNYDIQFAANIKTALFGGEGLALATLTGPGTVWLQSLPFSRMADSIISASKLGQGNRDEGSVIGKVGIGTLFGGKN